MDSYRGQEYNPFAPAMPNSGGAMEAQIPQLPAVQAAAMAEQDPSVKEKAIGVAMDKGLNYGANKGVEIIGSKLAGLGATSAPTSAAMLGRAGLTGAAPPAPAAAGAAMAPVLPIIIGAMALKSIFKK